MIRIRRNRETITPTATLVVCDPFVGVLFSGVSDVLTEMGLVASPVEGVVLDISTSRKIKKRITW